MDFGLFFLMQRDERWSERAVYDSARLRRSWPRSSLPARARCASAWT